MTSPNNYRNRYVPADNPDKPAPLEVREAVTLVCVAYLGFDHEVHHDGLIEVHHDLKEDVEAFFDAALTMGFPFERVGLSSDPEYHWDDDLLMAGNVSSGYNFRYIAGTTRISLHAGRAFDVNPRQNPYIRYLNGEKIVAPEGAVWDPAQPGTLYAEHPLVRMMEERGWEWGGRWTPDSGRTDYQHFQKAV